nr:TSUP family transporter [Nitrosospira sp. Nsp13]
MALSGVIAGFLSGLLGVGGGFVIVPALQKATNLSMQHIVPTSLAVIAIVSAAGVASSVAVGGLNWWPIAVPFVIGAVAGLLLTGAFAQRFSGPRLQQVFALLAAIVAGSMFAKGSMALAT